MHQQQRQIQTMAPQMRQSLEILQLPIMELRGLIQREMEQNPMIEDVTSPQEIVADTSSDSPINITDITNTAIEHSRNRDSLSQDTDDAADAADIGGIPKDTDVKALDFDRDTLRNMGEEDRGYLFDDEQISQPFTEEAQERRQYMFDSLTQTVSLQQHLIDQLLAADLSVEDTQIGEMIIGGLNDDGFLAMSLTDLSEQTAFPEEHIASVLRIVQTFDPPGIAARDLRECLLNQIANINSPGADLAEAIILRHLKELAQKKYAQIAAALNSSIENVENAATLIRSLNPKPASLLEGEIADYITPEVLVDRDENGHWYVRIDDDQLPHIRMSNDYRKMLDAPDVKADVKSYIRERIRSGNFLLKSIEQRQQTILTIATAIVEAQQDFFNKGVAFLKPMTMAEVAQKVDMHETTVSRTVANKYMKTPKGVFELKYFFTTGIMTQSGSMMSNKTVQDRIKTIVDNENPSAPLSDQAIMNKLADEGIKVARRTIVKYRTKLKIPSSNERKRA